MPMFRFTGDSERVFLYPQALVVGPGDIVDAPSNPDEAWFEPAAEKAPEPTPVLTTAQDEEE